MIFLFVLLTLLYVQPTIAAYTPQQYTNSPLITPGPNKVQIFQSTIAKQDYGYGMWYSVSDGQKVNIGISRSANGIDWYGDEVINISRQLHSHDPSILYENSTYTLYFGSSNGGTISIWKNTSQTDSGFVPDSAREILKSEGGWEGNSLSAPYIFKIQNTYYLLYAGNGNGKWHIGMAESSDGNTWIRCPNNPIITEGSGPSYVEKNGIHRLFFNSPNGIELKESSNFNGCFTQWSPSSIIDGGFGNPNPIVINDDIWTYGDIGSGIGVLSENTIHIRYPVVLIPGMFASWNKDALLHNEAVPQSAWTMNPVVTEYKPFIDVLHQMGYTDSQNLFVFQYDWRKPIEGSSDDLDTFLTNKIWSKNKYQPVQVVGHSLGGLIAHVYGQNMYESRPIKKILSIAAPLKGVLQSYKPVAAGEIERDNSILWIAENIILRLNTHLSETPRNVIDRFFPVLKDLIPTYSFLTRKDGAVIDTSLKNNLLATHQIDQKQVNLVRFAGQGFETKSSYVLSERTASDILFNSYPDGHPTRVLTSNGDMLVPVESSNLFTSFSQTAEHGETIFREDYLRSILHELKIDSQNLIIPQGKKTPIFPALLLFLQSPANMRLTGADGSMYESDSYIHVTDLSTNTFTLSVRGTDNGTYTLHSWLIGRIDDKWTTFSKTIRVDETQNYSLIFNEERGGYIQELAPLPTLKPTPQCIKTPSMNAYPHWCKSKIFTHICTILRRQITFSPPQSGGCRSTQKER